MLMFLLQAAACPAFLTYSKVAPAPTSNFGMTISSKFYFILFNMHPSDTWLLEKTFWGVGSKETEHFQLLLKNFFYKKSKLQ